MSSSSSVIASLFFITREINIFVGIFLFIAGTIGGILTLLVFLSLHTFRHNSCTFYLIVLSFVNIGQLITGLLSRITTNVSNIDWTQISLFYCKVRMYLLVVCTNISMICICLATIDQYFATSRRPRWQRWSNLTLARSLSIVSIVFSLLIAIPCLIYYKQYTSQITGNVSCTAIDVVFMQINIYLYRLIISNILPLFVTLVFGFLTYRNVRQIAYRTVPMVRRELDIQLTGMILVQDIFTFITLLPIMTLGVFSLNPSFTQDPLANARFQLLNVIAVMFYYLYFTGPFYIYLFVSERFRRQLKHVLLDMHVNRWRRPRIVIHRVRPQT